MEQPWVTGEESGSWAERRRVQPCYRVCWSGDKEALRPAEEPIGCALQRTLHVLNGGPERPEFQHFPDDAITSPRAADTTANFGKSIFLAVK